MRQVVKKQKQVRRSVIPMLGEGRLFLPQQLLLGKSHEGIPLRLALVPSRQGS